MAAIDPIQEQLEEVRRRAVPIPWAPPMPNVDWLPYRRVWRPLVAEAAASRLKGLIPALEAVDEAWAAEASRLVRILEAAAVAAPAAATVAPTPAPRAEAA